MKTLFMDQKGQAGAVFRLMIDAIIGIAILAIILSVMAYFQGLQVEVSKTQFVETVGYAVKSPNGQVFETEKPLLFSAGQGFSADQLGFQTNQPAGCFRFQSPLSSVDLKEESYISFTRNASAKVYAQCTLNSTECSSSECIMCCLISVGKELTETTE